MNLQEIASTETCWSSLERQAQLIDENHHNVPMTEQDHLEEQMQNDAALVDAHVQWYEDNTPQKNHQWPEQQTQTVQCTKNNTSDLTGRSTQQHVNPESFDYAIAVYFQTQEYERPFSTDIFDSIADSDIAEMLELKPPATTKKN